jgi:hypothetical protein
MHAAGASPARNVPGADFPGGSEPWSLLYGTEGEAFEEANPDL